MEDEQTNIVIMGAAGRDYWNFLQAYQHDPSYQVVAFTQTQIPGIADRTFPAALAGHLYDSDIPMRPEEDLPKIVEEYGVDTVVLAYSDLPFSYVMERASWVLSLGCNFELLGPDTTMISANKPIISVCAVRTGCGKSQTTRYVVDTLEAIGYTVVVVRHPMPYATDLASVTVQRFASTEDFAKYDMTIEELEEYEQHIRKGTVVYAGIDYEQILYEAEQEADVIVWDGGNNDLPFYQPDVHIVLADALRPGHEISYYPGSINMRMADILVINKVDTASVDAVTTVKENVASYNVDAAVYTARSPITLSPETELADERVLVIEDGPTVTHGEMRYGAGYVAARAHGANIIQPHLFAKGTIQETLAHYDLESVVPAMGYTDSELRDLERTIAASGCDYVIDASPVNLQRILNINVSVIQAHYDLVPEDGLAESIRHTIA